VRAPELQLPEPEKFPVFFPDAGNSRARSLGYNEWMADRSGLGMGTVRGNPIPYSLPPPTTRNEPLRAKEGSNEAAIDDRPCGGQHSKGAHIAR
jgi:hypothetical protein